MKNCTQCEGKMKEHTAKTPENISYNYYKCQKCGEEIVAMNQLHKVADKYRTLKRYQVKLSKWGLSLGLRIPKELVEYYKLKEEKKVVILPEKKGIKIITE
jgi:DNA-directed RNA polymerase subunit RPC12/RpoP|tara:strand:- start:15857 stop:16159 length:303 start_codon:yes stop_codon:yes gene_type:complete